MLCGIYAGTPETQRTKRDSDDRGESRPVQQDRYFQCTSGGTTTKRVHLLADIFDIFGSVHEQAENHRRFLTYLAMAGDMHYVCERGKNRMSTQSIAVETMVVSELRNLFADESALEAMLDKLRVSPSGESGSKAVLSRLIDLDLRASRIEILLDSMDRNQGGQVDSAFC